MNAPGSIAWLQEILGGSGEITEHYAVLPASRAPRLLVRVDHAKAIYPAVEGAAFLSGNLGRVARPLLGLLTRVGLDRCLGRRVGVPGKDSLSSAIAGALGEESVTLAIVTGPVRPNQKPVARVLNSDGHTLAFAKIGWNNYTNELVANESQALHEIVAPAGVQVPEVLAQVKHGSCDVLIVSPLRLKSARQPSVAPDRLYERILLEHPRDEVELASSSWWASAMDRAASIDLSEAAQHWLTQFLEIVQGPMMVGRCHGDWAPWNLLESRESWGVLDWERSRPDAPLGIDLVHQAVQLEIAQGGSVAEAAARAISTIQRVSFQDGSLRMLPADQLVALYLLEFWLRLGTSGRDGFDSRMAELVSSGLALLETGGTLKDRSA